MPRNSINCDSCDSRLVDKNNVKNYGGTILCRACSYALEKSLACKNENTSKDVHNVKLVSNEDSSAMICDSVSTSRVPSEVPSRFENITILNDDCLAASSSKEKLVLESEVNKVKLNYKRCPKFTKR